MSTLKAFFGKMKLILISENKMTMQRDSGFLNLFSQYNMIFFQFSDITICLFFPEEILFSNVTLWCEQLFIGLSVNIYKKYKKDAIGNLKNKIQSFVPYDSFPSLFSVSSIKFSKSCGMYLISLKFLDIML